MDWSALSSLLYLSWSSMSYHLPLWLIASFRLSWLFISSLPISCFSFYFTIGNCLVFQAIAFLGHFGFLLSQKAIASLWLTALSTNSRLMPVFPRQLVFISYVKLGEASHMPMAIFWLCTSMTLHTLLSIFFFVLADYASISMLMAITRIHTRHYFQT